MKYSIIIPVYNTPVEDFIVCISSIMAQDYKDFEVVVIDDGSSVDIKNQYEKICDENGAVIFHKENGGVSAARNYGIDHAKGEYLIFVDADDWIENKMLSFVDKNINDNDILIFNAYINTANDEYKNQFFLEDKILFADKIELYKQSIWKLLCKHSSMRNTVGTPWAKVYKRTIFDNKECRFPVGMRLSEDVIFNLYCYKVAHKITYINEAYYHYRINTSSASNGFKSLERQYQDNLRICTEIETFLDTIPYKHELDLALQHRLYLLLISELRAKASSYRSFKEIIETSKIKHEMLSEMIIASDDSFFKLFKSKKYLELYLNIRIRNICSFIKHLIVH